MEKHIRRAWASMLLLAVLMLGAGAALSQAELVSGVTAGQFIVERPTLLSAGFEWVIQGDVNHNAQVTVEFRKRGDSKWLPGLPMMRLMHEKFYEGFGTNIYYTAPNAFAGSLLNLQPGTEYEAHFKLTDPDGVTGEAEKTVTIKTRVEPMPAAGGHVYHVYPADWKGPKQEPSFVGLLAAYYSGQINGDLYNSYPVRVQAGDTILVHAGVYRDMSGWYMGKGNQQEWPYGAHFDGTYYLKGVGTPDKPIVIKAAGDGEVIFDGHYNAVLFDLTRAPYHYFENITVRATAIAFLLGRKDYGGSDGFTLKHSKIYDVARGVHDDWYGSKDIYIADNVITGRHDPNHLPADPQPINQVPGGSEYAIKVYGQGAVVAYNKVSNFHDGIDVDTYGLPDNYPNQNEADLPSSIDFYGNDITTVDDNCYEFDGGSRNIRYFRNRCFNVRAGALSANPGFGGPFYYYQNVVYNCRYNGMSLAGSGLLFYNNTWFCDIRRASFGNQHYLNNLIIGNLSMPQVRSPNGGPAGPGDEKPVSAIFDITTPTNYSSSDYNGFFPNPGATISFGWNSPPFNVLADYDNKPLVREFKTLADYVKGSGQDKHSRLVDYNIFVKASPPDRSDPDRVYHAQDYDFSLKPGSKAIDAGVVLPGITDGYTGKAPDLGAYEYGTPAPQYGPRG